VQDEISCLHKTLKIKGAVLMKWIIQLILGLLNGLASLYKTDKPQKQTVVDQKGIETKTESELLAELGIKTEDSDR